MANNNWQSYIEPLITLGDELSELLNDPADNQLCQELYKHLLSVISQSYFGLLYCNKEQPAFWPVLNAAFNTLAPNPDDAYYLAPIDSSGIYRISGTRGSAHIFNFTFGSGSFFTAGTGGFGPSKGELDVDQLNIDEAGRFDVLVSQKKPAEFDGDWWQLQPQTSNVMARQRSYDWVNEIDGRVAIERLDTPVTFSRPDANAISEQLQQVAQWAKRNTQWTIDIVNKYRSMGYTNKLLLHGYDDGGIQTQTYLDGLFDLKNDEALILETEIPDQCLYWSFQLTDEIYGSIDWVNRQSSLNGHSAQLDSDGKFRAVISAQDPGVANWLDNAGYERGIILGRWQQASSTPTPTIVKVNIADISKHLPEDTKMVSSQEREAAIRLRQRAAQMRQRW